MVKIRLTRFGKHKKPFYRIVAVDSRIKRDGKYLQLLGNYEPFSGNVNIKSELVLKFLNNGAKPSETVINILKKHGIYKQFLQSKTIKKKKKKRKSKNRKTNNPKATKTQSSNTIKAEPKENKA